MMYIDTKQGTSEVWHVGEENPISVSAIDSVIAVQVDCDELDYLYSRFPNLPKVVLSNGKTPRVIRWNGDMARFIVGNLT